jgi:hypothetical protein
MSNWAIVIGIDQYWNPKACLKGAVADALAFGEWLVQQGEVPKRNLYYLLGPDDERKIPPGLDSVRPTSDKFVETIDQLSLKSGLEGERFYFYYSGHGLSCRQDGRDEQALVPEDFTDRLTTKSFSLRSLRDYFAVTQFRDQFFFIDACRNIPWQGEFRIGEWPRPVSRNPGLPAPQQIVFFATSPGVQAKEIGEAGNERGAFTDALLKGLKGQAQAWDDGLHQYAVRVNGLFIFIRETVTTSRLLVQDKVARKLIQIPGFETEHGEQPDIDPVLARFPLLKAGSGLLLDAYEALQAEFSRIEQLIQSPGASGPLGSHLGEIQPRFNPHLLEFQEKLGKIERATEQGDLRQAWQDYGEARSHLLPALANDLLAAIGGFYLRDHRLDDAGIDVGRTDTLSFAKLAESLVKDDLMGRTGEQAYPVLIVGEERPDVSGAVIRLRFPAWDIWNLPLTAHEYGYILSRKRGVERLGVFYSFCKRIREEVNPSTHELSFDPDTAQCLLPEVHQFWNAYNAQPAEQDRKTFIERNQHKLAFLQGQQERFICRLFADAFATLFCGPAYLYALLHLRFWPDAAVPPDMPPFTDRFVFALEILRRMHETPKAEHPARFRARFGEVIRNLVDLWGVARKGAAVEGSDDDLAQRYKKWVDEIYACFDNYKVSIEKTYEFWNLSQNLEKVLRKPQENRELWPKAPPNVWVVLNAAWRARSDCARGELAGVIRNALSLLDKADASLIRKSTLDRPPGVPYIFSQEAGKSPEITKKNLRDSLEVDRKLQARFDSSLETGVMDPDVEDYLVGRSPELGDSYRFLLQDKKGKQD